MCATVIYNRFHAKIIIDHRHVPYAHLLDTAKSSLQALAEIIGAGHCRIPLCIRTPVVNGTKTTVRKEAEAWGQVLLFTISGLSCEHVKTAEN